MFLERCAPLSIVLPIALEWRLTDACNLRCRYCGGDKKPFVPADYGAALDRVVRLAPRHVWLGGGEPTLVDELPLIARTLKERLNAHLGLSTNLTRPGMARELVAYVDDLIISLDTADREISRRYRGIDPLAAVEVIRMLHARAKETGSRVNITVNSAVPREALEGDGIERLNDLLTEINPGLCQMFCPVFPQNSPLSIIGDPVATERFFGIVRRLREKGRSIMVNFPAAADGAAGDEGLKSDSFAGGEGRFRCYRRYFRLQMAGDGPFFSPCPAAPLKEPFCDRPCNCGGFLDDLVKSPSAGGFAASPVRGRLGGDEVERLKDFHRACGIAVPPGTDYGILLNNHDNEGPK